MSEEKPDFYKIVEEKLVQKSWGLVGFFMALCTFFWGTTLYALFYKDVVVGIVYGEEFSIFDTVMNILSIIFLGQFLLLLLRVIRTKKKGSKL